MGKPARPKKLTRTDLLIYSVFAVLYTALCAFIGTALDCVADADGQLDLMRLSEGMNRVITHPELIPLALSVRDSYVVKTVILGVVGAVLYVLYKYSEGRKRLHRQGVEHGSAKWADLKEMKSLADQKHRKERIPMRSENGQYLFDRRGHFDCAVADGNILLTQEVLLALDAHQHLLNLNVLVIGGSGAGKTRFYVKTNIMQLNTSFVITDPKGEILQATGKMLAAAGYEVRVLNLIEMQHSHNYNPFHYVYDKDGNLSADYIKKMINVLYESTKGEGEKNDFWAQKGQTLLEAITFLLFEESEYHAEFDENGRIIESTRDGTHLNFYSVTEKMHRLQYPPHGSQQPDGFFLEQSEYEDEAAFRARQDAAFLCPLDKDFLELKRRKPDSLAYRLYCEVRNAPEETGQSFLSSANVKTFMFNIKT